MDPSRVVVVFRFSKEKSLSPVEKARNLSSFSLNADLLTVIPNDFSHRDRHFNLPLGLLSFVLISRKNSVIGRTFTPFVQSSIVVVPSAEVTVSARQESVRQYNNTRQDTETKSFFEVTSYWRETITTTTKSSEYSFTNASSKQLLPALSVTLVSRSLLNDFIKSSLSTNVQPESFGPRYPSLNVKDSVSSSHENSFAISSTLYNMLAAEIIPTTSQVNGLSKASSTRDKAHLSTSQKGDKSRVSSQEAFIKSAFFDPRGVSNVFNSWTAQFTSSMSQGDSLYSVVVSKNETEMFTKGSVALTNGLRTSSSASTIRKTAELKLLSQAASHSSFRKETYQQSVKTFDTKITSVAIREQFAGISGISKTTENGKLTLIYQGFTSSFISTVLATGVSSTSVKTSSTSRPPSMKQSLYLSVMTSPVVLNKMSTNSMTTSTTPLPHMSVSANSSKVSSRSKSEFHTSSIEKKNSDVLSLSSNSTQTSGGGVSDVSTHKSISSVVPKESLRSSDLSEFAGRSSYLTEGMQTAPLSRPKTSQQTYLLSTSLVKAFSGSVDIPQNAGKQTPVSSKQSTALGENLSSSSLLHTQITMRSKSRSPRPPLCPMDLSLHPPV
ncbi:uncharacterized protein [Porites lutea]|uniref:uncharacterized protein n=1 Tax=Porites lutea TaxID=51062 RepID=UPI003CC5DE94